ncbi:alpha/beta hydrolase [Streptomyces cavernicola]|uniref:Alpha/beta hydrolase n=1 Tax=Streptomyces cavernicola TaxID=3043613 RepID=A0ABT6SIE5_9ACTN|nr:alpha/beta hydrolase [Streptomyces sp. B-S-A6]MDI3407745.1 alpha/beta hydrolase [Streptomyces sp. B-S-A6]
MPEPASAFLPAPVRRLRRIAAAVLAGALLVTGCGGAGERSPEKADVRDGARPSAKSSPGPGSSPPELPAALTGQRLDWGACADAPGDGWQCATMKAPLDHAEPAGETIDLALVRKKATGPGRRIGSLLFNFGGPGGSGVAALSASESAFGSLNSRYDLVSFDPRGVAASSGVRCRSDRELEAAGAEVDLTPDTAAEEKAYFADAADFGAGCERRAGKVLPHIGTADAARDMDLMREVLGDGKLHYFGFSYGTELGGTYAHLFPENVGRIVLDGVVDPSADTMGHARNQTTGFQRALDNYLKSTGADPKEGTHSLVALLKRMDAKPLPAGGGRELTESLALTGILASLYSEQSWSSLTDALDAARAGRGAQLLSLADQYNDRDPSGSYGTQSHAQRAISCADAKKRPTAAQARAALPEFRRISPVFGEFLGWDTAGWCHAWPVPGAHETPEVSAPGADPILVVGTTGDSATPIEGAERMVDELGRGVGVQLTYRGERHTAYGGGSSCVTSTVDGYLLDGKVPTRGKTCS